MSCIGCNGCVFYRDAADKQRTTRQERAEGAGAGVCFIGRAWRSNGVAEPREDAGERDAAGRAGAGVRGVRGGGPPAAGERGAPGAAGGAGAGRDAGGAENGEGRVRAAAAGERERDHGGPVAAARDRGVLAVPGGAGGRGGGRERGRVRGGAGGDGEPAAGV